MARIKSYNLKTTHFDFRRARVRGSQDGGKTWRIEDKFGLYYILHHIDFYKYMYADQLYNYAELKQLLLDELKEAKYENVVIITDDDDE